MKFKNTEYAICENHALANRFVISERGSIIIWKSQCNFLTYVGFLG